MTSHAAHAADADGLADPAVPGGTGLRALYVYYRVDADRLPGVLDQVRAMQAALVRDFCGLHGTLQRRPELRDGQVTLMETYAEGQAGALNSAFEQALAQHSRALPQPRHCEHFMRL